MGGEEGAEGARGSGAMGSRVSGRRTSNSAAPTQQRQRPEKEKMAAAALTNQRGAPARARPLPSPGPPRALDGSIRRNRPLPAAGLVAPGWYKVERGARVLLSAGGRGRRGGLCGGGVGVERQRWGSGVPHSHCTAPRCSCPRSL